MKGKTLFLNYFNSLSKKLSTYATKIKLNKIGFNRIRNNGALECCSYGRILKKNTPICHFSDASKMKGLDAFLSLNRIENFFRMCNRILDEPPAGVHTSANNPCDKNAFPVCFKSSVIKIGLKVF